MKYNEINQNEVSTTYVPFDNANADQIKINLEMIR